MIRQLNAIDANIYRTIRLEALRNEVNTFVSTYETESKKEELFMERCLRTGDKKNIIFGAFIDEKLVGIAGFVISHPEIIQVYVNPDHRGNGIGQALLTTVFGHAFNRFPYLGCIDIAVVLTSKNAVGLYKRLGFESFRRDVGAAIKADRSFDILNLRLSRKNWEQSDE